MVLLLCSTVLASSTLASTVTISAQNEETSPMTYVQAPYALDEVSIYEEYLEPVFYQNDEGPLVGVTTVGVLESADGEFFKDSNNNQELDPFEDWRLTTDERVEDVLSKLSIEQKTAYTLNHLMTSPTISDSEELYDEEGNILMDGLITESETSFGPFDLEDYIDRGLRASVVRTQADPDIMAAFNNVMGQFAEYDSASKNEVGLPYTVISNPTNHSKGITGTSEDNHSTYATYPASLGLAAAVMGEEDYSLITHFAENSRREWDATGIDMMYGPQIDIVSDPRWPRNADTYGEVPEVVAEIATSLVSGYQQGTDGLKEGSVGLTIKHFPGDGPSENGWESHSASGKWRLYPTEGSLENYHLVPFQSAIDAKVAAIMSAYSIQATDARSATQTVYGQEYELEEVASAYNYGVTTELLRDIMGFEGFVNTDSGIIPRSEPFEGEISVYTFIKNYGIEDLDTTEAMARLISAGSDVLGGEFLPEYIVDAVETGLLDEADLNLSVSRRLESAFNLGQFENQYRDPAAAVAVSAETTVDEKIYEAHQKAVVLMKNSENTLPMSDTTAKVYVEYFGGEEPKEDKPTFEDISLQLAGEFEGRGFEIVTDYNEADIAYLMVEPRKLTFSDKHFQILDLVEGVEVDLYDIPFSQEKTGETMEYSNVLNIDRIAEISKAVRANDGKVVAAISNTSPWILSNLEPHADALVGLYGSWFDAQVDVLTGEVSPSGKLPITMVSSADVIAVNPEERDGVTYQISVSPNDVPGYDKDQYIDEEILSSIEGGSYAYQDADGNYYEAGFGLTYE